MSDASVAIYRAHEKYVDTVVDQLVAWLRQQGVYLTERAEEQIADAIRFGSK